MLSSSLSHFLRAVLGAPTSVVGNTEDILLFKGQGKTYCPSIHAPHIQLSWERESRDGYFQSLFGRRIGEQAAAPTAASVAACRRRHRDPPYWPAPPTPSHPLIKQISSNQQRSVVEVKIRRGQFGLLSPDPRSNSSHPSSAV